MTPLLLGRRDFLQNLTATAALATLLRGEGFSAEKKAAGGLPNLPHFAPRAKRVVFLFQSGAPSQVDLFDYKPLLAERHGQEIPESVRRGQRLTTMTADQKSKPLTASPFKFARHGGSGMWVSDLLPHTAKIVDELCFVRTVHTEAVNHDPGLTFFQTGSQHPGRPCIGSWISYGLGSWNQNLPTFMVLLSGGLPGDQPLYGRLWGSGFLPSMHAGTRLMPTGDAVPYLSNPPGLSRDARRTMLDSLRELNQATADRQHDPETAARIEQYELAFRMQQATPELLDLRDETAATFDLYGPESRTPGTFAANCLLARRMLERDVRFVQLYHRDWDHHQQLPPKLRARCKEIDQPGAALVADLKQRGLLEDTLVVWAGEFGRTSFCQGALSGEEYGRDHHPRCFTVWMAGGGVKAGQIHGTTDEFSYNVAEDPVHVHDLQATLLHLLGVDHEKLLYRFQGRDFRLTDIAGEVVRGILA